jgi:hypothetical protein
VDELLQRLKQRKIVQWALAYVAAAFALIQVLDIVAQRFGRPEQTVRLIIILLAIGFFVTNGSRFTMRSWPGYTHIGVLLPARTHVQVNMTPPSRNVQYPIQRCRHL